MQKGDRREPTSVMCENSLRLAFQGNNEYLRFAAIITKFGLIEDGLVSQQSLSLCALSESHRTYPRPML